jgi:glutamate synthase domain-containing protein 1
MHRYQRPEAAGLYDPSYEHDNCGVGAVACLTGNASHSTVQRALDVLDAREHRGASGAEIDTGDGAGILLQTPHELLSQVTDFELPPPGQYAAGMVFLPKEQGTRQAIESLIEQTIEQQGQTLLGWRDVPVNHDVPGASAAAVEPTIRQVLVGSGLGND